MKEGTVVRWLLDEGSEVSVGDALAEIETDKAVVEFESTASGVLRKIIAPEGTVVPIGQPIAIVGTDEEPLPESAVITETKTLPGNLPVSAENPDSQPGPPPASNAEPVSIPTGQVRASPVARRLSEERGIDLSQITGTGPGGRITRDDVLGFEPAYTTRHEDEDTTVPNDGNVAEVIPMTKMRQQISNVTVRSKQQIPHFYVTADVDMTETMNLRSHMNRDLNDSNSRISVNDFIIKACVGALRKYPKFNASFHDDGVHLNNMINVGIAIAEDEGLIVPAILDCSDKSLPEIASASKDLIDRSKSGALRSQEYTGGTFSISNLGMFNVSSFTAIILPPQSAVLAVGTVQKRPVVREDQIAISQMMTATLSADHRIADGAEGAEFLIEIKRLLENPLNLVL